MCSGTLKYNKLSIIRDNVLHIISIYPLPARIDHHAVFYDMFHASDANTGCKHTKCSLFHSICHPQMLQCLLIADGMIVTPLQVHVTEKPENGTTHRVNRSYWLAWEQQDDNREDCPQIKYFPTADIDHYTSLMNSATEFLCVKTFSGKVVVDLFPI